MKPLWETSLGGQLTQPVTGGGLLYVADAKRHSVYGLDAETGTLHWTFQAGGAVDSSPTYDNGRLLFGSADGHVYCLRASDGELAWRFLAAPIDRRMVAFEQLESVWPVHGSVLVQAGIASFVAGRSVYLDGGLRVCRLDVETGRLLSENVLGDRDPDTGEDFQIHVKGLNMPVGLPDILSSDGEHLFMRSQVMDLQGNRLVLGPAGSGFPHLFAPYGFTDDSWFHRTYWLFGDRYSGGVGGFGNGKTSPAGRILVHNDSTVFGYGRKPEYYRWGSVIDYQLFAALRQPAPSPAALKRRGGGGRGASRSGIDYLWTRDVPLLVRALALAGDRLLIAGPVDALDEDTTFQNFGREDTQEQIVAQDAALRGESGSMFQVVDAGTGETRTELRLDSPPVFDGLSVANGCVFVATMGCHVVCIGK
jgi:hypothetical protein